MEYIIIDTFRMGLPYALLALGIFISYRVLDIADLSCEGTFTLGAALSTVLILLGWNPFLSTIMGVLAGFVAGIITGLIHTKLKITALLSGIITMTALFSINMVILGIGTDKPYEALRNIGKEKTIYDVIDIFSKQNYDIILISLLIVIFVSFLTYWFFGTEIGMGLRATGINQRMARAQGINTNVMIVFGLGLSNALIALSGSLLAQTQRNAANTMGVGVLVIGLASIIIGEGIFGKRSFKNWMISVLLGALMYYVIIVIALELGLPSYYQKLLYALLILLVLVVPLIKKKIVSLVGGKRDVNA